MQCPVCEGPAKEITPPGLDGVSVDCPTCALFDVTDKAIKKLEGLGTEGRRGALTKAIQFWTDDPRPCISTACLPGWATWAL